MKSLRSFAFAGLAALALSACGGGSGSAPSGGIGITPPTTPTTAPKPSDRAVATISLHVPRAEPFNAGPTSSSAKRSPQYLSPGTDKIAILLDKNEVVVDQPVVNFNNAGPSNNGTFTAPDGSTFQISYDSSNPAYFAVDVKITTTPGTHEFGVVIKSGTPAYVLSEGQGTYTLIPTAPGGTPQNLGQLLLNGVMGTGYIECDTAAQNTDATGQCSSYSNFTPNPSGPGGTYAFTAVVADFDGFPIVYQTNSGNTPYPFDNGSYSVVETDANSVVTINQPGAPWPNPGNHLTGPSSGYVPGTSFVYGNAFTVTCAKVGTATLQLKLAPNTGSHPSTGSVGAGADGYPTGTGGYDFGDPNNTFSHGNAYTYSAEADGSVLPVGQRTPGNAGGNPPRQGQPNVTVNCTANGTLQLI